MSLNGKSPFEQKFLATSSVVLYKKFVANLKRNVVVESVLTASMYVNNCIIRRAFLLCMQQ